MDLGIDKYLERILFRLYLAISEIAGIIIFTAVTISSGVIIFYVRKYIFVGLNKIGVSYFAERLKNIREINSDLIWIQGAFKADVYALFRTYNGKAYIDDNDFSHYETNSKKLSAIKKIKIRKLNSKPDEFFPEEIDKQLYKIIIDKTIVNDWQYFSYDSVKSEDPNSPLLVLMEAEFINNLLTYRIWDKKNKTYGIILFAWNEEPHIPDIFTKQISKKLDSIAIRFQSYIEGSILEKIGYRKIK